MRVTETASSNKRNSSPSSLEPPVNQRNKSAKASLGHDSHANHSAASRQQQQQSNQVKQRRNTRGGKQDHPTNRASSSGARLKRINELRNLLEIETENARRSVDADMDARHDGSDVDGDEEDECRQQEEDEERLQQQLMIGTSASARVINRQHISEGDDHRKQTHNVIEKRRRDKMNNYIMELASVIPSFSNNQSKFDKLTVLRMAVQHVKSLRSSLCSFSSLHLRPSFLSSGNLLKNLILQMASHEGQDNLFMVVTCDRGKVLFVSESSKDILNHEQHELVGQCLFDILHKDDVSEVKEQISYFNLMPKEMLVDSKTLQPIKQNQRQSFSQLQNQSNSMPQPGARRSFFCRMRSGRSAPPQETKNSSPPSAASSSTASPTSTASSSSPGSSSSLSSPSSSLSPLTQTKQQSTSICDDVSSKEENIVLDNRQVCEVPAIRNDVAIEEIATTTGYMQDRESSQQMSSNLSDINLDKSSSDSNLNKSRKAQEREKRKNSETLVETQTDYDRVEPDRQTSSSEKYHENNDRDRNDDIRKHSNKHKAKSKIHQESAGRQASGGNQYKSSRSGKNDRNDSSRSSRTSSGCVTSNTSQTSSDRSPENESAQPENAGDNRRNKTAYTSKSSSNTANSMHPSSKKYWRYIVMHCTGYLKSVTLRNDEFDDDDFDDYKSENNSSDEDENDGCRTINCLVAVCRRSPMDMDLKPDRPLTFTCRYSMEGKFVFVDQRTTVALGYTPQQLLGTSHYAYCHKNSVNTFKECHSLSIQKSEPVSSDIYQFKRANGQHLWLQTSLKSFRNPWTKIIDYIVANHTTAEGNEPHYNEGCVPTKFNQDMTGVEGSQSFSPASSFTLSLPSMDSSKKSSSPSSSSIGSSYSMDSCASGACIQGILNRIDRAKSGGIKYALDLHKRKSDSVATRSSDNSSKKSAEDSGNSSELQSCSSMTFPNNLTQMECQMNVPFTGYFGDGTYNDTPVTSNLPNTQNVQASVINNYRPVQNFAPNYQSPCQMVSTNTSADDPQGCKQQQTGQNMVRSIRTARTNARTSTGKVGRSLNSTIKQHNQPRHYDNQYHYRNQLKSGSSTSSDTGNESATWSNSSGSNRSNHHEVAQAGESTRASTTQDQVSRNEESQGVCQVHFQDHLCQTLQNKLNPYVMQQPVESTPMNVVPSQVQIQERISGIDEGQMNTNGYSNELMPIATYINHGVTQNFSSGLDMNQIRMSSDIQSNQMAMTAQDHHHHHQQQQVQHQHRQQDESNQMSMPMMWNTTSTGNSNENPYSNMQVVHSNHCQQICTSAGTSMMNMDMLHANNPIMSQQKSQCQQCANNKCPVRQIMMTNNTDLNSTDLTSLAVDGDLDEDQLIEYLAGCEPSYHVQNNSFPQYNIYR